MATIDFGSDYSTFRDDGTPGMTFRKITGPRVPLEGVVRAWLTDPGDLPWAKTFGFNVTRLQNSSHKGDALKLLARRLELVAKDVDFVQGATVTLKPVGDGIEISGFIRLTGAGTYPLNVTASAAGDVIVKFSV